VQEFSVVTYLSAYYNRFEKGDEKGRGGGIEKISANTGGTPGRYGF
jgi:hypothetical protein